MPVELKEQRKTIKQSLLETFRLDDENRTNIEKFCQLAQNVACSLYSSPNKNLPFFQIAKDVDLFKKCSNDEERYNALIDLSTSLIFLQSEGYIHQEKYDYTLTEVGQKTFE